MPKLTTTKVIMEILIIIKQIMVKQTRNFKQLWKNNHD